MKSERVVSQGEINEVLEIRAARLFLPDSAFGGLKFGFWGPNSANLEKSSFLGVQEPGKVRFRGCKSPDHGNFALFRPL